MRKNIKSIVLKLTLTGFLVVGISPTLHAADKGPQGKTFGLGIIAGDPTGVTGKGYLSSRLAVSGIAAWSFINDAFTAIADVTYDMFEIHHNNKVDTPFYVGAGAKLAINKKMPGGDKTAIGIRVPVGIAAQWENIPVEGYVEIAPGIELSPETEFDLTGGVGVRYYF